MDRETLSHLIWLIPLLPILGFAVNVFLGRGLPRFFVSVASCGVVLGSAILSWITFFAVRAGGPLVSSSLAWIDVPGTGPEAMLRVFLEHKLLADPLTCVMILVVTNVGFLIHLYSTAYMADDKRYARYFAFLNLFTGFMLILVMGSNLLLMFVGWEGVGLCSYLLIGFWFEKRENAAAGMKAFIVNRVGDFGFTVGLLLLFTYMGHAFGVWTLDFLELSSAVAARSSEIDVAVMTAVGILLFVGACGKSAQIPLFVWLPDAMAGPTPVSALIHAATMVTAGVYMIARMNFVYALSPAAMTVVAAVGAATALFAGTIGVAQNDIKKVLAYSTVSQLGFMFMGVGVGAFAAGIFHLMTHAFFKACLFLGSGSVIHGMGGEQDIRKMGGLKQHMPITFWTFTVASLAIAGFPLLAGFWSKDEILWKTWSTQALVLPGWMLWLLGITAAAFTAFYMTRLVVLTFLGEPRWSVAPAPDPADAGHGTHDAGHATHDAGHATHDSGHPAWHGPHESPWPMTAPLVVLMVLSIVGGFIGMPHWMPGGGVFEHWLDPVCPDMTQGRAAETALLSPTAAGAHPQEHEGQAHGPPVMEILLMLVSIGVGLGGIWAGLKVYYWGRGKRAEAFAERNRELYELVRDKYRVDELYQNVVIEPLLAVNETVGRFDNAIVDGAVNGAGDASVGLSKRTGIFDNDVVDGGVNATALAIQFAGRATRRIQTGRIRSYVQSAVVGGLVVIALYCVYLQRDALGVFMGWK